MTLSSVGRAGCVFHQTGPSTNANKVQCHHRHMSDKKSLTIFAGIAFLVLASGILWFVFSSGRQTATGPALQITLGSFIDARLTELRTGKLADALSLGGASVVSRARRQDIGAAVTVIRQPNEIGGTLILENQNGNEFLDAPFGIKDAPALSFDGSLIAYSALALPVNEAMYSENVSDWRIHLFNVANGEDTDIGAGYAPYFVSQIPLVLAYSSPEGIVSFAVESGEMSAFEIPRGIGGTARAARVSPDGKHLIAYNAITRQWSIYTVVEPHPLAVSSLGEVQSAFDRVALSDAYFFGIHRDEATGTMTLWRYPLDAIAPLMRLEDGELLYTFIDGEHPYQIVP